jgi:hypothetical protein
MITVYRFLHVLLAFAWFAAVFAAHWNGMQARRSNSWSARATLFGVNRGLSMMIALPSLIGLGLVGNVFAMQMGYSMKSSLSFMMANGLWSVLVLITLVLEMPTAGALGALSHAAAEAGATNEPAGWSREFGRWRAANGVLLLGFLLLLGVMVSPWAARP